MIDWLPALFVLPLIIISIGLLVMMARKDDGPSERERMLEKTLETYLKANQQELDARKQNEQSRQD